MIAPTMVPRKAMHMVSSSRYSTPCFVRLKSSFVSGWKMPDRMFAAIFAPLWVVPAVSTAVPLHMSSAMTTRATLSSKIQGLGRCS